MKSLVGRFLACIGVAFFSGVSPAFGQGREIVLATTTSVRDAGLLDRILPRFMDSTGYEIKTIAVGSGHAMELGRRGEADLLILHDPAGEERFVTEGYGVDRAALMHSEFIIAGPAADPAQIEGMNAVAAFQRIAERHARFLSRGDNSGTHAKEMTLWGLAGRTPDRSWHWETGQGMGASLQIAAELDAYILTDIGTYLKHPARSVLRVLVSGDEVLFNPYHVIRVNEARWDHVNVEGARALEAYLLSPGVRAVVATYGLAEFGRPLFVPDEEEQMVP